jgi:hypothetical protein
LFAGGLAETVEEAEEEEDRAQVGWGYEQEAKFQIWMHPKKPSA